MTPARRPEVFTVTLQTLERDPDTPEMVRVHQFDSCTCALAFAHSWARAEFGRLAEVWCGDWIVYSSDAFDDLLLQYPQYPRGPGLYAVEITPDQEVKYLLVKEDKQIGLRKINIVTSRLDAKGEPSL